MPNRPLEQEKPRFPQPDAYIEAMGTPEMVKARMTVETLVGNGTLLVSQDLYTEPEAPVLFTSNQLQFLPVTGTDIPVLVVAPTDTEIRLHEDSRSDRIVVHVPQGLGDRDPCYVLEMREFRMYPRETVLKNRDSNAGRFGFCCTASVDHLGAAAVTNILKEKTLSAIVLFTG